MTNKHSYHQDNADGNTEVPSAYAAGSDATDAFGLSPLEPEPAGYRHNELAAHLDPQEVGILETDADRLQRVITTRTFLPEQNPDWPRLNIAAKPRGTRIRLGLIAGEANRAERRTTPYKDKELVSILLTGDFDAILSDGEVVTATQLYLPMAAAEAVERALQLPGCTAVELDLEIGLEATGRSIPYEWIVISRGGIGEPSRIKRSIRERQKTRETHRLALTAETLPNKPMITNA